MIAKRNCCSNEKKCVHMKKTFEELKKDFPYFRADNFESLRYLVCDLCGRESRGVYDYKNHGYR